jgi:putative transcriptional regulator
VNCTICGGYISARLKWSVCAMPYGGRRGVLKTRIMEFRKERRVTQEELADAVNVTRQTIISLENGKYKASLVLAHKIAQYFGVTIEEMFLFDKEEENL